MIEERVLRVGDARLTTGCIGAVMVRPEHRGRGIGRQLMADSAAFAERRRLALLLLCGINDMYARFGYADVFDPTEQLVPRAQVLELPASPCQVRPGTVDDAEGLLELYRSHFWRHPGAFDRTLAEQRWRIESYRGAPDVAVDPSGRIRGYATAPVGDKKQRIEEVVADGWPAAVALLHHHAAQAPEAEELGWWLPPTSPTFWLLADRLSLRSVTWRVRDGEWMAKPGHLPTLLEALAPVWRARLGRLGAGAAGAVVVEVGGASFWLQVGPGQPAARSDPSWPRLHLSASALSQLVFGCRPIDSLPAADGLPASALGVLAAAFPYGEAWIAGSDAF
jgi:GNAT superfamily N-acetyltransferase